MTASTTPPLWLPGATPCAGCRGARHPSVGKVLCPVCGTVRWTLAVTGSRSLASHPDRVLDAARDGLRELRERMGGWPALVLHGDAPGVDRILARHLTAAGWPVHALPADWDRHGRRAGVLRDLSLIARADALLAIWDGTSPGTRHTLTLAAKRDLPIAARTIADQTRQPERPAAGRVP